ncbi:MAG: hypothetical protein RJA63_1001 [Pseudomonadota bacterium]|jgi:tRNA(fMet)-specific endonuclease VapC
MLDTNICIYILNNKPPSVRQRFLDLPTESFLLSSIVVGELAFGAAKSRSPLAYDKLNAFLDSCQIAHFDDVAAMHWGEIRGKLQLQGTPIGHFDTQIAAHALALDCTLVTNNLREFERVPGLKLENWID